MIGHLPVSCAVMHDADSATTSSSGTTASSQWVFKGRQADSQPAKQPACLPGSQSTRQILCVAVQQDHTMNRQTDIETDRQTDLSVDLPAWHDWQACLLGKHADLVSLVL